MIKNLIYLYIILSIPRLNCQEPADSILTKKGDASLNNDRRNIQPIQGILPPVIFAKATGSLFIEEYRQDYFGKFFHCHNKDYFADIRFTNLKNSEYLKCGILFNQFEKYCVKSLIVYDKRELRHYRYMSVSWNIAMGLIAPTLVVIFLDASRVSSRTGYAKLPNAFFRGDYAMFLWPAVSLEFIFGTGIRSNAEKRLKDRLFTNAL